MTALYGLQATPTVSGSLSTSLRGDPNHSHPDITPVHPRPNVIGIAGLTWLRCIATDCSPRGSGLRFEVSKPAKNELVKNLNCGLGSTQADSKGPLKLFSPIIYVFVRLPDVAIFAQNLEVVFIQGILRIDRPWLYVVDMYGYAYIRRSSTAFACVSALR